MLSGTSSYADVNDDTSSLGARRSLLSSATILPFRDANDAEDELMSSSFRQAETPGGWASASRASSNYSIGSSRFGVSGGSLLDSAASSAMLASMFASRWPARLHSHRQSVEQDVEGLIKSQTINTTEPSPLPPPPSAKLLPFAEPNDWLLLSLGLLFSIAAGAAAALTALPIGATITAFQAPVAIADIHRHAAELVALGGASWLARAASAACHARASSRLLLRARTALLAQLVAAGDADAMARDWLAAHAFDAARALVLGDDARALEQLLGRELGDAARAAAQAITAVATAFVTSWRLALVASGAALVLQCAAMLWVMQRRDGGEGDAVEAMEAAREALRGVRTLAAFDAQRKAGDAFAALLQRATAAQVALARRRAAAFAVATCATWALLVVIVGYRDGSVERWLQSSAALLLAAAALSALFPSLATARSSYATAAPLLAALAAAESDANTKHEPQPVPMQCRGELELRGAARSWRVAVGERVAVVGAASAAVASRLAHLDLMESDQSELQVLLDGRDVRGIDRRWLRAQVAVVAPSPSFFLGSIVDNLVLGLEESEEEACGNGSELPTHLQLQAVAAAKLAGVHDAVMALPEQYGTLLNADDLPPALLRRLALARALARRAKLLLIELDDCEQLDAALIDLLRASSPPRASRRTMLLLIPRASREVMTRLATLVDRVVSVTDDQQGNGGDCGPLSLDDSDEEEPSDRPDAIDERCEYQDDDLLVSTALSSYDSHHRLQVATPMRSTVLSSSSTETVESVAVSRTAVEWTALERRLLLGAALSAAVVGLAAPFAAALLAAAIANRLVRGSSNGMELAVAAGSAGIAVAAAKALQLYLTRALRERARARLGERHLRALLALPLLELQATPVEQLERELQTRAASAALLAGEAQSRAAQAAAALTGAAAIALASCGAAGRAACWQLAAPALALLLPAALYIEALAAAAETEPHTATDDAAQAPVAHAAQTLAQLELALALGVERRRVAAFARELRVASSQSTQSTRQLALVCGLRAGLRSFGAALALVLAAHAIDARAPSAAQLRAAFAPALVVLLAARDVGRQLAWRRRHVTAASVDTKAILALCDRAQRHAAAQQALNSVASGSTALRGGVALRRVSFAYSPRGPWVLRHASLSIQPGETAALMGGAGSGKSTLLALLAALYEPVETVSDPRSGVFLDGVDARALAQRHVRRHIGWLSLEPHSEPLLFRGSVADNIALGLGPLMDYDHGAIVAAARLARAHEFIARLPEGYATPAARLEGDASQLQRLALARAIVREPKLLLVDDADRADPADAVGDALLHVVSNRRRQRRTTLLTARAVELRRRGTWPRRAIDEMRVDRVLRLTASGAVVEQRTPLPAVEDDSSAESSLGSSAASFLSEL